MSNLFLDSVMEQAPVGFVRHFAFAELVRERPFNFDLPSARLQFEGLEPMDMQALGFFSSQDETFHWAWTQPQQLGEAVCSLAHHLREQGQRPGLELFATPQLPASQVPPFALGVACSGVAPEACFWCAPISIGYLMVLVLNPPLDLQKVSREAFQSALEQTALFLGGKLEALLAMATRLGYGLEPQGTATTVQVGEQRFEFPIDTRGVLASTPPEEPAPPAQASPPQAEASPPVEEAYPPAAEPSAPPQSFVPTPAAIPPAPPQPPAATTAPETAPPPPREVQAPVQAPVEAPASAAPQAAAPPPAAPPAAALPSPAPASAAPATNPAVPMAGALPPLVSSEEEDVDELLARADDCLRGNDAEGAREALLSVLEARPETARAHLLLGGLELEDGHLEEAELHLLIGLAQTPQAMGYRSLARVYQETNRPALALAARRRVLELEPDQFGYYLYGLELAKGQRFLEAAQMLQEAIPHWPDPRTPLELHGRLAAMLGRRSEAITSLQKLSELGADEATTQELARLLAQPGG